jgi:hypothetical protein
MMPRREAHDLGRILTMTSWQISRITDTAANQVVEKQLFEGCIPQKREMVRRSFESKKSRLNLAIRS